MNLKSIIYILIINFSYGLNAAARSQVIAHRSEDIMLVKFIYNLDLIGVRKALARGANPNACFIVFFKDEVDFPHGNAQGSPCIFMLLNKVITMFNPFDDNAKMNRRTQKTILAILKQLIRYKANINAQNQYNETPLYFITHFANFFYRDKYLFVVKALVRSGADVNTVDVSQVPCLMRAAQHGNKAIFKFLLESGADHTLLDSNGYDINHWIHQSSDKYTLLDIFNNHIKVRHKILRIQIMFFIGDALAVISAEYIIGEDPDKKALYNFKKIMGYC